MTVSLWAQANAAPAADRGSVDFSSIENRLTTECASEEFSGVVVVKRPDGQLFRHVCGVADAKGAPITLDTRFKMFSTTKFLTAVTIMRLVEMGKFDLDGSLRYVGHDGGNIDWIRVAVARKLAAR